MISIIVPTKNEEKAIKKVINELKSTLKKEEHGYEIIVVDNSQDRTPRIAKKQGAKVIEQEKEGKGCAIRKGVKGAKGNIIVLIDGDGTYPPKKIPKMIQYVKEGCDLVVGSRFKQGISNMKSFHILGNKIFTKLFSTLYKPSTDILTGLRALKKDKFLELNTQSKGFGIETEIHIKASKKRWKIKEVGTGYRKREGKSKLGSLSTGLKILGKLIRGKI